MKITHDETKEIRKPVAFLRYEVGEQSLGMRTQHKGLNGGDIAYLNSNGLVWVANSLTFDEEIKGATKIFYEGDSVTITF